MSLQERTLVVKNFDPDRTTSSLLKELFLQGGPVRNVVVKPDHAFVEFEDIESVGYSKALLDGVEMFGRRLELEPKTRYQSHFRFTKLLQDYIQYDKHQRFQAAQQQEMMAYYQQQQQLQAQPPPPQPIGYPPFDPSLQSPQAPNNFVHAMDPQICGYNALPQNQFISPNQMPSTSMPRYVDMRRSRSFNHHNNDSNKNRNRPPQNRGHEWSRERR